MAFQYYIKLDGKKYKILDDGQWRPTIERPRTYQVGLTGLSIIQDFTVSSRIPQLWTGTFRIFINDPIPDSSWGGFDDLLAAYNQPAVTFIEHDDTLSHSVGIATRLDKIPRVGANISGDCNGIFHIPLQLVKIFT